MKVGILTFHYGSNYGGVLQCYALQQVLKSMGHDVFVINYVPWDAFKKFAHVLLEFFQKRDRRSFRDLLHFIRCHKGSRKVFRSFREQHLLMTFESANIHAFKNLPCDVAVVGSDQIWNYTQHRKTAYFLGWLQNPSIRKVSYAACCGQNRVNEKFRSQLVKQLSDFSAISVRSNETREFVNDILGKDVPTVLDPTFLYDFKEFVKPVKEKYILTYILTDDIRGGDRHAVDLIKTYYPGLPVYSLIISDRQPRLCSWADRRLFDVSPDEWVNLLYHCAFLYTDSFHGAVFAMKFGRPFIGYYNHEVSGRRLVDLQKMFQLRNIVTSVEEVGDVLRRGDAFADISESPAFETAKNQSIRFLQNVLR